MSDTTVMKVQGDEIRCKTVYGANYVKKVTHPPADARFEGTPSKASPNVAIFEIISETNVPVTFQTHVQGKDPIISDINAPAMLFLTPSGGKVGSYVFYRTANNTWAQQSWLNAPPTIPEPKGLCAVRNDAYDWYNSYAKDFASCRQAYKSTTFYLNATKNNNQGIVTTAKFKPSIINTARKLNETFNLDTSMMSKFTLGQLIDCLKSNGHKHSVNQLQRVHTDLSNKFKNMNIEEDGYQVLGKSEKNINATINDLEVQMFNLGTIPGGTYSTPTYDYSQWLSNVLPNDATQLLNLSKKAASRMAVDGAFVVQADSDDVNLFMSAPNGHPQDGDSTSTTKFGLVVTFICWYDPDKPIMNFVPLYDTPVKTSTETFKFCDIPWNMSDWSWTLFDGLSTSNAEAWGLPYITVKTVTGWEAQPRVKSFPALVQRLLPLPDPDALEMAAGIHLQRPDSLPASANDLGTVAATVLQFLPTAVGWLKDLFGSKPKQEQAMQRANQFIQPKKQRDSRKIGSNTVNKIAKAIEKKLDRNIQQLPIMPKVIANKNPAEQYKKPSGRSSSRNRPKSKKKPTMIIHNSSMANNRK